MMAVDPGRTGPMPQARPVQAPAGALASPRWVMPSFFAFFVVSGFCGLVYEVVWLRLAMARFGVTTPTVSIVLSVFMAGLALGSWSVGRLAARVTGDRPRTLVRWYGMTELLIASSGAVVPVALAYGQRLLALGGGGVGWGSGTYYVASAAWICVALLPFCVGMGATFPLAMGAIRSLVSGRQARYSFGHLYLANVMGATGGTLASAFVLIELLGFRGTLAVAAGLNALLGTLALVVSRHWIRGHEESAPPVEPAVVPAAGWHSSEGAGAALFSTGFASMAMEVIWTRQFTPYLGTVVYSFALILATYLVATFAGSRLYRLRLRSAAPIATRPPGVAVFSALGVLGVSSLLAADFRLPLPGGMGGGLIRVVLGIGPFCALLGFVTPLLVDRWSRGDPGRAGLAYATNTVGCILGPLAAGFLLLPAVGERWAVLALALLLFLVAALRLRPSLQTGVTRPLRLLWIPGVAVVVAVAITLATADFDQGIPNAVVRRDATATVIACGEGMGKQLLVNGIGMTTLTPVTKMMAHLPLAFLRTPARRALTICFGMGTTFRSVLSWGIESRGVELVPSVPLLFGYFHPDGPQLLKLPNAKVSIDDGRRYLERSGEAYDVIIIDPPPPPEAAGSSLLYSREFYEAVRKHLRPGGIVQQWLPWGGPTMVAAFAQALRASFPYVRVFRSLEGWGFHFLASAEPIPATSARELAGRMPPAAVRDMLEWGPAATAAAQIDLVLAQEFPLADLISRAPTTAALDDDRPINEYFLMRRTFRRMNRPGNPLVKPLVPRS